MHVSMEYPRETAPLKPRHATTHAYACRAVPIMAAVVFLSWCCISIHHNFDFDDANPEILDNAWQLANGRPVYRSLGSAPYTIAVYTPLYLGLVALSLKFAGLSYFPAKLITLLFAISIGFAAVQLCRLWGKPSRDGVWTALLCLLIPAVLFNATRSHPQMMAVALSLWSLVFFLKNRWFPTLILSPLLAVLAFYTKQSQVALPLALLLYLALRNRRWLLPYAGVGAVAGLLPFLWLQSATKGAFFQNAFILSRLSYDWRNIPLTFLHWAGPIIFFLVFALILMWRRFRQRQWTPMDLYLAILFPLTVISLGRVGSHSQYVVELVIVVLLYLLYTRGLPHMKGGAALVVVQVFALIAYASAFILIEEGPWNLASVKAADRFYPVIQKESGPILSKQGSFALFGRGSIYIQLFQFGGMHNAGLWDQRPVLTDIRNQKFSWVITQFPIDAPSASRADTDRFSPAMIVALRQHYALHETRYPYYLYARRPAGKRTSRSRELLFR